MVYVCECGGGGGEVGPVSQPISENENIIELLRVQQVRNAQ